MMSRAIASMIVSVVFAAGCVGDQANPVAEESPELSGEQVGQLEQGLLGLHRETTYYSDASLSFEVGGCIRRAGCITSNGNACWGSKTRWSTVTTEDC